MAGMWEELLDHRISVGCVKAAEWCINDHRHRPPRNLSKGPQRSDGEELVFACGELSAAKGLALMKQSHLEVVGVNSKVIQEHGLATQEVEALQQRFL